MIVFPIWSTLQNHLEKRTNELVASVDAALFVRRTARFRCLSLFGVERIWDGRLQRPTYRSRYLYIWFLAALLLDCVGAQTMFGLPGTLRQSSGSSIAFDRVSNFLHRLFVARKFFFFFFFWPWPVKHSFLFTRFRQTSKAQLDTLERRVDCFCFILTMFARLLPWLPNQTGSSSVQFPTIPNYRCTFTTRSDFIQSNFCYFKRHMLFSFYLFIFYLFFIFLAVSDPLSYSILLIWSAVRISFCLFSCSFVFFFFFFRFSFWSLIAFHVLPSTVGPSLRVRSHEPCTHNWFSLIILT